MAAALALLGRAAALLGGGRRLLRCGAGGGLGLRGCGEGRGAPSSAGSVGNRRWRCVQGLRRLGGEGPQQGDQLGGAPEAASDGLFPLPEGKPSCF